MKDFLEPILKHPGESLAAVGFLAAVYVLMSVSQELFSDKSGLEPQDAITILESGEPALLIDLRCGWSINFLLYGDYYLQKHPFSTHVHPSLLYPLPCWRDNIVMHLTLL